MSDNNTRTAKNVRRILKDRGYVHSLPSCLTTCQANSALPSGFTAPVAYAFKKIGKIVLRPREDATYEQVWDDVIEAGAEDLEGEMDVTNPSETELDVSGHVMEFSHSDRVILSCFQVAVDPEQLKSVSLALSSPPCEYAILESGFEYVPADPDAPPPELSEEDETRLDTLCKELAEDPDVEALWTLRGRYE